MPFTEGGGPLAWCYEWAVHSLSSFSHWLGPLIGGVLIGLAASLFLLAHGRVCGVSGLLAGLLARGSEVWSLRATFLGGLLAGGLAMRLLTPQVFASSWVPSLGFALGAGLLVGVGTQLSGGCTSGHGICGVSRLSMRSFIATGTFVFTGIATVTVVRHMLGGG